MPVPGTKADHFILAAAIALQKLHAQRTVVLVSKDINLRIKARMLGVHAEEYYSDQVIDDVDLLYTGVLDLAADFWDQHGKDMSCWQENGRTRYTVRGPLAEQCFPNQFVCHQNHRNLEAVVRRIEDHEATIEQVIDYRATRNAVWGITARNREQNFALNLLLDPSVDFVTLLGTAGTGKTLLALAAGLAQTMETQGYREIVMTRVTVPVGEDIGFLPGTEEEKMTPWMGALMDNLEVLTQTESAGEWGRAATTI